MPELPEVETIKNDLQRLVVGKKILNISTTSAKQVKPSLEAVKKTITGTKITKVARRAKLLQIFLNNSWILAIHLKMTGRLLVRNQDDPPDDWQRVTLDLSGGKQLRLADLRKFGWVRLISKQEREKILQEFGPEPLADLTLANLKKILSTTGQAVKIVIMDQKKIAGVGNIYACDALFLARLDPRRPANKLAGEEVKSLLAAIEKVLRAGIKDRGASDQYYLDALGHKGHYQQHFLVYNREGKQCFGCQGRVKKIKLGGRGTYFCPDCQR